MEYNLVRAREAVQFLVDSPYGTRHIARIKSLVDKPRSTPFRDEAETLNELLVIGRQSKEALLKLIDVAEFKRRTRGSYQREFMATKRQRERKVLQIEGFVQNRTLSLDERVLALQQQYQRWNTEKTAFLATRTPLEWASRNKAIGEFWAKVDAELDRKIILAREQEERVVHRKKVIHQSWLKPAGQLGEKLFDALQQTRVFTRNPLTNYTK